MTKATVVLQVPARRLGSALPGAIAVGPAVLERRDERTSNAGTHARRFAARWSKGTAEGDATIEIRPLSKITTEIAVTLEPPTGPRGVFWLNATRRRLAQLFVQALAYELETRNIEETDAFEVRRTSAELVKARSA